MTNRNELKRMVLEVAKHTPAMDYADVFKNLDDVIDSTDEDLIIEAYNSIERAQKERMIQWLEDTAPAKKNPFLD